MHAYLLVGQGISNFHNEAGYLLPISKLAQKLHAKIMEFPLVKIDDTRSLNNLIRLSFKEPTLIVCQNIHQAGEEALNAFLKNLEEPQENIYFALTAPSARKVLPTIVSRCQIIRTMVTLRDNNSQLTINNGDVEEFTKLTAGEKLSYIDKIKDRDKAVELAENLVNFYHNTIHSDPRQEVGPLDRVARNAEATGTTLNHLKANGNINLQLTNLIINLV